MVKSGDGGARRPAPQTTQGRPQPKPAGRPLEEEVEEKTSALNLADVNLDDIDEMPMPKAAPAPAKRAAAPAPRAAAPVDEGEEKTSAINLADVNLDDMDEMPMPQAAPKAAPKAAAPAGPAPQARAAAPAAKAAAPAPAPERKPLVNTAARGPSTPMARAPAAPADDDGNEKTAAISADDFQQAMRERNASRIAAAAGGAGAGASGGAKSAANAPAPATAKAAAPSPVKAAQPVPKAAPKPAPDTFEKTTAVSLDDLEPKRGASAKGKAAPAAADRTFLVEDDDVPVVKAPAAKKVAGKADGGGAGGGSHAAAASKAPVDPADLEPKLAVRAGPDTGKVFSITKDLTMVGRGLDADLVINDASASRKHFNIVRTLSGWKLVDLGSGNGTRVNGARVSEQLLEQGTTIECGGTTMEVLFEEPAQVAAPPKKADVKRETVKEDAPAPSRHPGTLYPGGDEPPARRGGGGAAPAEDKGAGGRRRDVSRFDESDEKGKGKGKADKGEGGGEEKTQFANIAELSIDPAWEKRRNAQRKDSGPDDMVPVSGSDDDDLEAEVAAMQAKKGGIGKKLAIAGVVVAVLGGGFVGIGAATGMFDGGTVSKPSTDTTASGAGEGEKGEGEKGEGEKGDKGDKAEGDKGDKAEGDKGDKAEGDKGDKAEGDKGDKGDKAEGDKGDKAEGDKGDKAEVGGTAPAGDAKEGAKKLVAEGKALAKDGKIVAARAKFLEAMKADVGVEGGKDALTESEAQLKNLAFFVAGEKSLGTKKWADGIDALKKIPEASPLTASTKALLSVLEQRYMLEQAALLQVAFAKKDWAGAKAALEPMLKQMPTSGELQSAKNAIDKASAADADVLDVSTLDPSDKRVKAPPKVPAQDFKAAFDAYAKGTFEQAVNAFDGVQFGGQASKGDVARSQFFSALVTANGEIWKVANEAQAAGKLDDALNGYRKAKVLDAMLGGQLKAKFDAEVVKALGALAKKATDEKKPFDAAVLASRAVALDPKSPLAKTSVEPAVKEAKANFAKAKGTAKDQPDQALDVVMKALQLLPPEDPDFAAAASLADELLKL